MTDLALAVAERPPAGAPAGILALSGFIPHDPGWTAALGDRLATRVLIAHGRRDPVISVQFARVARARLMDAGLDVDYAESDAGHGIEPLDLDRARGWPGGLLPAATSARA